MKIKTQLIQFSKYFWIWLWLYDSHFSRS